MDSSTPGFPVLHHLPDLAQTYVHWVGDASQPSHSILLPSVFSSWIWLFQALELGASWSLFCWHHCSSHLPFQANMLLVHKQWRWEISWCGGGGRCMCGEETSMQGTRLGAEWHSSAFMHLVPIFQEASREQLAATYLSPLHLSLPQRKTHLFLNLVAS